MVLPLGGKRGTHAESDELFITGNLDGWWHTWSLLSSKKISQQESLIRFPDS